MKKSFSLILALIMVFTLAVPTLAVLPVAAEESDETTYNAEIMNVKGGASAIVTFTIDDGVYANDVLVESLFREYGLKAATLMLVPKRVQGLDGSGRTTVSQAWDLMRDGYVEVQSHSYSHLYLAPEGHPDYNAANITDENRYREVVESYNWLTENFPDVDQIAFAVPGGTYDEATTELVMQTYYASRRSSHFTSGTWQSLTPENTATEGGWYFLRTFWLYDADTQAALDYLDLCIEKGGWFLAGTHNIIPSGLNDISEENFRTILAAVKEKQDQGLVWATNYSTAVKYLREYENATVKQYSNNFGLYVDLTMSETTAAGLPLSADIFDEPLTVKVEIPEGWANVRFSQKGLHTTANSFKEGDKTYAYVDIVPNSGSVLISNADVSLEKQSTTSTLTPAKGGAVSIATMTFDDGHKKTAEKLNELLAKYDAKASLMIYPSKSFTSAAEIQYWNQIASEGCLNIESHSYTHAYITSAYPENHYEEKYIYETKGAQDYIRESIDGQDVLSMTIPYASYINDAYKHVISTYYSALAGACALTTKSYQGMIQSLDPTFANPETGAHPAGSWHNVLYARLQPIYSDTVYPELTMENIIAYLDKCVAQSGWFITSCHGIYEGENQDLTEAQLIQLLEAMSAYQKQNKLWVTSFSEATKYVRERQNSTVTSYTYGDGIYYVDLTMAATTADGLSLTETITESDGTVRQIFNMPLTVKVEVPKAWTEIVYTQAGGEKQYADTFTEQGRTYAYIDLLPNGGTATFESTTGASLDQEAPERPVGYYEAPTGSYVPTNPDVVFATFASEDDFKAGNAPINEYTEASLTEEAALEGAYLHLYKDITDSVKFKLTGTLVINLAGHSLTSPAGLAEVKSGGHLTVKNGFHYNKQQIHSRANSTLIFDNVHFINTYHTFGWGLGSDLIIFRNCKLDMNTQGFYFFLSGNNHNETKSEMKFINTDLNINAGVSTDFGLFRITESDYYTTRWTVSFDKDCMIKGTIDKWATCIESTTVGPASGGEIDKYQRFSVTQRIFFEEGVTFSEPAPDFTYDFVKLSDDNSSVSNLYDLPANDSILKMAVVHPGTEYSYIGEVEYTEDGDYYKIGVPNGRLDVPVGTYLPVEGVWTPDDPSITYALWSTENAYLTGKAPYKTFTSSTFEAADVESGGYVHLYSNLTASAVIYPKNSLVINLAGHKLTASKGFEARGASIQFTLKNGTVTTEAQINLRDSCTALFENVHYYNGNAAFGYGSNYKRWTIKDCIIELNNASSYLFLGGNKPTDAFETLFINTDIKVNGGTHATNGLLKLTSSANATVSPVVFFDKDSSLTGNIGMFMTATETAANYFGVPCEIRMEEGFTISPSVYSQVFKYTGALREGTEGNYTVSSPTLRDVNDGKVNVIILLPGETTATEYGYEFVKSGDNYVLSINDPASPDEPDTPVEPDEPDDPEAWTPAAGTTYAVWASKDDYLAGNAPVAEFSGALTVANLTAAGKTNYIRVYAASVETSECIWPTSGETIHIDLAGNTLTNAWGVEITNGATFILENGTYNHTNRQAYYKDACYATYRDLTITMTTYANITYGGGFTELTYENCTVYLKGANNYFRFSAISGGTRYKLNIINTDFVVNVALSQPFFYFIEASYNSDCNYEINIDGKSSITGTGSMPAFAALYENYRYGSGTHYYEQFVNTQNINIADGFEISKNLLTGFGTYQFYELDREASAAGMDKAVYKDPVTLPANDSRLSVTLGGVLVNDGRLYLNPNSDKTAYAISYSMDKVNIGWYRYDSAAGAWVGTPAVKTESGNALFTPADYKSFSKGETILFAQNIEIQSEIISSNVNNTDYVFDLSGNTMVLNNTFAFSLYASSAYQYMSITFKNGTVEGNVNQPFYGYGHKDGVFTFENITFNYHMSRTMASVYTGTFRFIDCVINAEKGTAFSFESGDLYQAFEIEGTTVNAQIVVNYLGACSTVGGYNCYIKDSVLNATSAIVQNNPTASTYRTLLISGSELNVGSVLSTKNTAGCITVEISDCKLTGEPKLYVNTALSENTDYAKVVFASGEKLMAVTGLDGFSYVVDKSPLTSGDLQANLTLYTDFQLNIFARPEVIDSILVNGEALDYIEFEGRNKYSVRDITPDTAAQTVTITVTATVNGVTYTFDIEYSVLSYAKSAIASDSVDAEAKKLISAAMAYVEAAYIYAGKTAPEFEGVDFDTYTASANATNMPTAIKGAQLDLDSGFKLRFNITAGYTGTVVVNGVSYEVVDGAYNGITYFEVEMRAYALYNTPVVITADGVTGSYSLANYVEFANAQGGTIASLANALYTYAVYANAYKALGN